MFYLLLACLPFSNLIAHEDHHHNEAQHDGHRQHGSHQHGVVEFHLAQDAEQIVIQLITPGADVMGFEHRPETAEQQQAFQHAVAMLNTPEALFQLNKEAQCELLTKKVEFSLDKENSTESTKHAHGEFDAQYSYQCDKENQLRSLEYSWFDIFSTTEKIAIQSLTDQGAKAGEVTAQSRKYAF